MKEFNTDVLIVGSGLVGLLAAHCLSSLNYKVTLVDKKNLISSQNSFKDTRTVAVSEGSKIFLESLSLWGYLDRYAEPIKNINVYDRSSHNKILFSNQIKNKKLGYVIENKQFSKILINQLKKFKNTKLQYGFNLVNAELNDKCTRAFSNNSIINSKIIIAADGKNSQIKKIVGNKTFKKKYNESALVLNLVHEKQLNNSAYEIFYKTGPLAILPMKSSKGFFQSTIIWSNDDMFLRKLTSLEKTFLKNFMEEKIFLDGRNFICVPDSFDFPTSFSGFLASPSLNSIKNFLPSLLISNSNFSDKAFTTETPTPCKPPDTLYES